MDFSKTCKALYRFGFNGKEKDDEVTGTGNSVDFGARIYDGRLGKWLSLDPLQTKYPSLSPYHFSVNNPIAFNDQDGREPNRAQATTVAGFFEYIKNNVKTSNGRPVTTTDIYKHLKEYSTTCMRYIYTKENGWLDMNHVFSVIENGKKATDALEPLSGNGIIRNVLFDGNGETSYYSYDDLPSNAFASGLEIAAKRKCGIPDAEDFCRMEEQIIQAGATKPEEAPNYRQIPANQDREIVKNWIGNVQELNPEQLKSGKYVPQNHSEKPYDHRDFPAASTSLEKTEGKR